MTGMDVVRDLWSKEFLSAMAGVVVGGLVTFFVAMYQARKSLEALRIQGEEARRLAKEDREAVHAREAGMLIMDLLLAQRSGLKEHGTEEDWLEEQGPVIDRIRSYTRILPEGRHRTFLLDLLKDLKRRRPAGYHEVAFKNDKVKVANAALVVIGSHMNGEDVTGGAQLAEMRRAWDRAAEEAHNRMIEAMENEPPPDDWENDAGPRQSSPSPSS